MELEGAQTIAADRQTVWSALNDPDILKACIPGCQSLEKAEDGQGFDAVVKQKVGPVSATFKGSIRLEDLNPPESYTISGEGKGGAAGFAKGGAKVRLAEAAGGTELSYTAEAKVGGKLAQLGGRVVDGFARKMADEFFARFKSEVEGPGAADAEVARREGGAAPAGAGSAASPAATAGVAQRPIQSEWAAGAVPSDQAAGAQPGRPPHEAPPQAAAGKTGPGAGGSPGGAGSAESVAEASRGPVPKDPGAAPGGETESEKKSMWKRLFG